MDELRAQFKETTLAWLDLYVPGEETFYFNILVIAWIVIVAVLLHISLRLIAHRLITKYEEKRQTRTQLTALSHKLLRRVSFIIQSAVVLVQAGVWFEEGTFTLRVMEVLGEQSIILFILLTIFTLLDIFQALTDLRPKRTQFPLKGLLQTVKLIASVLTGILLVSLLMDKSPLLLLSGLGAISAILLLVFKDPILGLVAGIQLSANNMLSLGDWLEMPKYGADGDVIDIALTTVKVRNWDKTITTIPTYALISDSFKNWRGMTEVGGRRIKRCVYLQMSSIGFLDEKTLTRLHKADLLAPYLEAKLAQIKETNTTSKTDMSILLNGRRLTNLGTFRQYLVSYLKTHPKIRQDMTLIVRQLQSTNLGLPMEIYAFTNTTNWNEYEDIQSDILDHVLAVLHEFSLQVHEDPTGQDVRFLQTAFKPEPTKVD
ncbi:MAG: miniconductance mechanosensitive channel [Alphaproteobacteria bacterium]|jgi:miniconductance mechanosensitive channel